MFLNKSKYICKAAEFSLLFQPGGEVLPCHYNRGYILGNYPKDSIKAIWFSKKRKILIKSIRSGKFDNYCDYCKLALKDGYINKSGIYKYEYIIPGKHKMPVSMEFQLANICNLECIMCSGEYSSQIRKNREKGDPYISPYDDNFVDQLEEFIPYLKQASFTGGEPFLFDIYYKIWDVIKTKNPEMQLFISSNGTVLNDKVKSYLNDLNFNLSISVDSLDKINYERIRKNAVFENTLANLDYYIKYCKVKNLNFNIKSLVTPLNYKDIPDILNYCNERGINFIPKTVMIPAFANFKFSNTQEIYDAINIIEKTIQEKDKLLENQNTKRLNEICKELKNIVKNKNEETTKYERLTNDELKDLLLNHLANQIHDKKNNTNELNINNKLLYLYSLVENENELRRAIISFLDISPQVLLSEFNRSDIRKLAARFKQCGIII